MKKEILKRGLVWAGCTFLLLGAVLCVHIYMVTRPKMPKEDLLMMARIDVKQPITAQDAATITQWLYKQKGVDHVLCNPSSRITVFTFYPAKASADAIVANFKTNLPYKADRFLPTKNDLKGGCPVAATSFSYKAYHFINHLF